MKKTMVTIGTFLFKYRNYLFPLYILALFLLFRPPSSEPGTGLLRMIALILALSGLAVRGITIGYAYIKRGGVNKKVYAENLVTEGMFSISRNPLYVGNMLIYAGEFLMFGNFACFIIGVLSFWFIYECIIATEENYLKNKFGDAYLEYCRDVPRWIPQFQKFGEATRDMKFDLKKVITKDYSTMLTTLTVLVTIEIWRVIALYGFAASRGKVIFLVIIVVIMTLIASSVRYFKKKKPAPAASK